MDGTKRLPRADAQATASPALYVGWTMPPSAGAAEVALLLQSLTSKLASSGVRAHEALLGSGGRLLWRLDGGRCCAEAAVGAAGIRGASFCQGAVLQLAPFGAAAAGDDSSVNVVVELRGDPAVSPEALVPAESVCLAAHRVRPRRAVIGADGRTWLAFYQAPDAEAVRVAQRHGAIPPGRVWAFRILDGGKAPGAEDHQR